MRLTYNDKVLNSHFAEKLYPEVIDLSGIEVIDLRLERDGSCANFFFQLNEALKEKEIPLKWDVSNKNYEVFVAIKFIGVSSLSLADRRTDNLYNGVIQYEMDEILAVFTNQLQSISFYCNSIYIEALKPVFF